MSVSIADARFADNEGASAFEPSKAVRRAKKIHEPWPSGRDRCACHAGPAGDWKNSPKIDWVTHLCGIRPRLGAISFYCVTDPGRRLERGCPGESSGGRHARVNAIDICSSRSDVILSNGWKNSPKFLFVLSKLDRRLEIPPHAGTRAKHLPAWGRFHRAFAAQTHFPQVADGRLKVRGLGGGRQMGAAEALGWSGEDL
jgi:hypothetical protein